MFSLRSSLLFKVPRSIRQFSHQPPVVRWAAFFPKEKQFLKYLMKRTAHDLYATDINQDLLNKDFGSHTYDDFFGPNAIVDLARLYSISYEDLNAVEKRQRTAMKKELDNVIDLLNLRLDIGKAIHERNAELLKGLTGYYAKNSGFMAWIESLRGNVNLYEYIAKLPTAMPNEITLVSDYEFAHYPFLAPFKFRNLCRITEEIREKLENMPHNFAGILGSIPVAMTETEAATMGVSIDENYIGKHPLYLFNISIIVTGHGVITFVPKTVKSGIDICYPIIKFVMHDGSLYVDALNTEEDSQRTLQNSINSAPTLESRKYLYTHFSEFPLVNLEHAHSRITTMHIGRGIVHIVPEICLEHAHGKAAKLWENNDEILFKQGSFTKDEESYILHFLIASGSPEVAIANIIGEKLFVHDRAPGSTFIVDRNKVRSTPFSSAMNNANVDLVMFQPKSLALDRQVEQKPEKGMSF